MILGQVGGANLYLTSFEMNGNDDCTIFWSHKDPKWIAPFGRQADLRPPVPRGRAQTWVKRKTKVWGVPRWRDLYNYK
jgi:hypothetical protein